MKRPVARLGRKMILWGNELLAWGGYHTSITSTSPESAPPFIGASLLECIASVPTIYRCVMRKAMDKARVPMLIGRNVNGDFKPMDPTTNDMGSPARLFRGINPNEGSMSFRARLDAMMQLTGDGFVQVEYLKNPKPQELWLLQSPLVTVIKGPAKRPKAYEYGPPDSPERITLLPEQVFHARLPNPADDWRGLAPLRSTQICAWLEKQIIEFNTEFFARGGVPPGWIAFDGDVLPDERQDLRTELQRVTQGRENRKRIGVLWNGAKWVPAGMSAQEGEFIELLKTCREEICSVSGVPPMYVGDLRDASYANAAEQKEMYWGDTIPGELDLFAQDVTELLLWRLFGDETLECRFDYDAVPAIQDIRLRRAASLIPLVSGGIFTQNEAREELDKPRATGGDTLYAPQVLAPTGTVTGLSPAKHGAPALALRKAFVDDPARRAKRVESRSDLEKYVAIVNSLFVDLADRQEKRLQASVKGKAAVTKDGTDEFDLELAESEIEATLLQGYARIVSERGQSALDGVVSDGDFNVKIAGISDWMEAKAGLKSKLIAETERKQVAALFARANEQGLTSSELATELTALFDLRRAEALRIAWTETTMAYNFATVQGFKQSEVVNKKGWLTAEDDLVRSIDAGDEFDHAAMDNVAVGLEEDFVVPGKNGDEAVGFPGEGSAGNAINCRCVLTHEIDEEAKRARTIRRSLPRVADLDLDVLLATK